MNQADEVQMNGKMTHKPAGARTATATPRVGVFIPNYNYARFIAETLHSVMAQSHPLLDVIVVDDGSSDDSAAVIERCLARFGGGRRTAFYRQPVNGGKLAALNAVMHEITAPYMLTLDADDQLEPLYVERCLQALIEARVDDPQVAMVYSDCQLIDVAGEFIDHGRSTAFDVDKLQTMSYIPEPALCLSEACLEVMPFDPHIRVGTKHHKWLRMVARGWRGLHIAEPLFRYRMHDQNLSSIGRRVLKEIESGQLGERILSGYWTATRA
ncbi:MAG: glycosyltransferase family A protein [Xanthomonadales bacterium]|nr:glycosyltransferase family A protein [Xanthomonadales bacterium]